jgi:hypothetical protein
VTSKTRLLDRTARQPKTRAASGALYDGDDLPPSLRSRRADNPVARRTTSVVESLTTVSDGQE